MLPSNNFSKHRCTYYFIHRCFSFISQKSLPFKPSSTKHALSFNFVYFVEQSANFKETTVFSNSVLILDTKIASEKWYLLLLYSQMKYIFIIRTMLVPIYFYQKAKFTTLYYFLFYIKCYKNRFICRFKTMTDRTKWFVEI